VWKLGWALSHYKSRYFSIYFCYFSTIPFAHLVTRKHLFLTPLGRINWLNVIKLKTFVFFILVLLENTLSCYFMLQILALICHLILYIVIFGRHRFWVHMVIDIISCLWMIILNFCGHFLYRENQKFFPHFCISRHLFEPNLSGT